MQKLTKYKPEVTDHKWILIDCENIRLGKLGNAITGILLGKENPHAVSYIPESVKIVVINTDKMSIFPKKMVTKMYQWHSGFPGGFKERNLRTQFDLDSTVVLRDAVSGMLPKTRLRDRYLANLYLYKGAEHDHGNHELNTLDLKNR